MRDLDLGNGIVVPEQSLRAATSRSSGPGGQHVNTTETRVTIELDVETLPLTDAQKELVRDRLRGRITKDGVLRVTSQAERSQLAELLRDAIEERKPRRATRVSKASKQRRIEEKKRRGETKKMRGKVGI
jgi:ribosome-associated protein